MTGGGNSTAATRTKLWAVAPPAVAVVGSVLLMIVVHRLWLAHLGVPLAYSGDSVPHALAIEQVLVNGWYWSDPRSGAPFGQNFQDWPLPDTLMLFQARLLSPFVDGWGAAVNLIYLFTYPCIALSGWWVANRLGVSRWMAVVVGILYAFLPYHFFRGEYHLFLAGYFTVPLGLWMVLSVLDGKKDVLFARRPGRENSSPLHPATFATWPTLRTLIFCILLACSSAYYTIFTMLLLVVVVLARIVRRPSDPGAIPGIAILGLLAGLVLANAAPAVLYHQEYGENFQGSHRGPYETEHYGLKISQMLLPTLNHRIDSFAEVTGTYFDKFPLPSEGSSSALGIVGAFGLMALFVVVLAALVRRSDTGPGDDLRRLSVVALASILIATIGGFATIIALLITPQIRSWNRMSVFIGFLALVAVGLLVDRLLTRLRRPNRPVFSSVVSAAVMSSILAVGILDQTTDAWVYPYRATEAAYFNDKNFVDGIERTLPDDALVFQLPIMQFPEAQPINGTEAYDPLKPRLLSEDLRWSFGGVKGRLEGDWHERLLDDTPRELATALAAVGFQGVYVDRNAYLPGESPEQELAAIFGVAPQQSADGRYAFYDIRPFVERLKATQSGLLEVERSDALFPAYFEAINGLYPIEVVDGRTARWVDGPSVVLSVYNNADAAQRTKLSFALSTATGLPASFDITWPDGTRQSVTAGAVPVDVERVVEVDELRNYMSIRTDAERGAPGDPRPLHFRIWDLDASPVTP